MRNAFLIAAIAMFIAAGVLLGWNHLRGEPLPEGLIVDAREHQFGTTQPVEVRHDYILTNGLPYPVEFLGIVKSCGCTKAALDKKSLKPREQARLSCTFNLAGRAGDFATSLNVLYRKTGGTDKDTRGVICAAFATVDPIVRLSTEVLRFEAGKPSTQTIDVNIRDGHSRITAVSVAQKAFSVSVNSDRKRITVKFDPSLWASANGTPALTIRTDCPNETNIRVALLVLSRPVVETTGE
ncbi:MAG TPA: DUF1573 domain-containing protein [Tepidisphaeraceae bacterium]|nr:DUF1573 domain-containing protein [Tepidisphaeraceae bacterium]